MSFQTEITRALLATAPTAAQEKRTTPYRIPALDGTYLVEVLGFVMLQKVVPGRYRLAIRNGVARFYKPKGTKLVVAHREGDVRGSNGREGDLNGINYLACADQATVQALAAHTPELAPGECFDIAVTFDPLGKYAGQDYVVRQQVVTVCDQSKEYEVQIIQPAGREQGPSRRSFTDLHRQLREDPRLSRVPLAA